MNRPQAILLIGGALTLILLLSLPACEARSVVQIGRPCADVQAALRQYYKDKYPSYAALAAPNQVPPTSPDESRRIADLHRTVPVTMIIHSFPHGPVLTIEERTQQPNGNVAVTRMDLYRNDDGTCRIVIRTDERDPQNDLGAADGRPITEEEIRNILDR